MKKWLIRYLVMNLLAFALPEGVTVSLLELGNLISHFQDHRHKDQENNFLKFIASHYFNKHQLEANHDDHEQLPFHGHHSENANFTPQTPSLQPEQSSNCLFTKLVIQYAIAIPEITTWLSSSHLDDIWQPPRS